MKNTFTVARFLAVAFAIAVAVALWWVMRPSFIHDEDAHGYCCKDDVCSQTVATEQQAVVQTEAASLDQSKPCCTELDQTKPCCAQLGKEKPSPATKKPSAKHKPGTKAPATEQPIVVKPTPIPGKVLVTNGIERKMLGYRKFGTHYPTTFKVSVDKSMIPQGGTCVATPTNNTINVRYDFEFMNGYRHGAMEVTFNLKPGTDIVTLNWNWKGEHRLFLAEADKVVSIVEKDVPYQK